MIDMTKVVPFIKNAEFINEDNMIFTIDGTEYKTEKQITKREFEKTFNAYIKLDIKKNMGLYNLTDEFFCVYLSRILKKEKKM